MGAKTDIKVNLFTDANKIEKSQEAVLLEITKDDKLSFKIHFENICWTVKNKLHELQRMMKYFITDKAETLCNAFIMRH